MTTIGFVELTSISRGVLTADTMVKAADVELIFSKPVCPGKFILLINGDVGAVKASISAGLEVGANFVVDSLVIPNVDDQVIPAINNVTSVGSVNAMGVVEFFSITGTIIAADAAVKAADVKLMQACLGVGLGGKSFLTFSGDVSAVESAVDAATRDGIEKGMIVDYCVIPSPTEAVFFNLI